MTTPQFHLIEIGFECLSLSLLIYVLFTDKKVVAQTWADRFSPEARRNWTLRRFFKALPRQAVALFFYAGIFLLIAAI